MRIKSYNEALRLARAAGEDAANRRMRAAGRTSWSSADQAHATNVTARILTDLGFDIGDWIATAGLKRNMPDEPPRRGKRKPKAETAPVQLNFSFN